MKSCCKSNGNFRRFVLCSFIGSKQICSLNKLNKMPSLCALAVTVADFGSTLGAVKVRFLMPAILSEVSTVILQQVNLGMVPQIKPWSTYLLHRFPRKSARQRTWSLRLLNDLNHRHKNVSSMLNKIKCTQVVTRLTIAVETMKRMHIIT